MSGRLPSPTCGTDRVTRALPFQKKDMAALPCVSPDELGAGTPRVGGHRQPLCPQHPISVLWGGAWGGGSPSPGETRFTHPWPQSPSEDMLDLCKNVVEKEVLPTRGLSVLHMFRGMFLQPFSRV